MRLGNRCGCHQREDRSFHIRGWQFPICSRCMGILTGQIIGIMMYVLSFQIPFWLDACFLGIMFLDWYLQYKQIKESTNVRRFLTGNLAGIAQMSIFIKVVTMFITWII